MNDSMCVTHRWLFERRTIVDGPFFLSSPPPPHLPRYSPPSPLHNPYRPACVNSPRRQHLEASGLGMQGVYPTVRSGDNNTWGLIDFGGGGGGYLTVHTEDNTWELRLGICGVYPTVHTEDNDIWELIDLAYVGFIPQSTQMTMALGNSETWDMWGLSHSPHRRQWHLGTQRLGICGVYPTVHTEDNGTWEPLDSGCEGLIVDRRRQHLGTLGLYIWGFIQQSTGSGRQHWGTLGLGRSLSYSSPTR